MIHSATSLHTFRASRWLVFLLALIAATIMAACSPGTDTTTAVSTPTLAATAVSHNRGNSSPPTTTPTPTPLPPTHTPSPSDTPAGSPTAGPSPTTAPTETPTQTPTATPTSAPQVAPELNEELFEYIYNEDEDATPISATAVPTPVPTFEAPSGTTNILLLGSDTPLGQDDTRTDTIIIASINSDGPTASIVSIPRDLFVYIPGWTMTRINSAYEHGERKDYPDGGIGLLKQTILYNFGIPIHYYARVDFNGFQGVVDAMDGVDLAVSCEFTDWRLKSPELDVEDPENWEPYTLAPGMHHLDGDLALWYARSRLMSSDFDRGRRQQQLLQAMFNQGVDLGLVSQFPALWDVYKDSVDTDMDIGRMLQFAAMAPALRENGIQHLYLAGKTQGWTTPGGASVLLPVWEGEGMMQETFQRLFLPPALNRAGRAPMTVEIINATDNPDMAALAADNLAWYGFVPVIADAQPDPDAVTQLTYYGPNFKGSYDWLISWVFSMYRANIQLVDDVDYPYNYQVILGSDYDPCRPQMYAPQAFLEQ